MTDYCYLIFDEFGFTEAKKTDKFTLRPKHRAVRIRVEIPDVAFQPSGMLNANLVVPVDLVYRPSEDVEAEVIP